MTGKPKFCSNCGEKLDSNEEIKRCPKSGIDLQVGPTYHTPVVQQLPYKSPGTAALIAFIGGIFALPGIGHIYVGKVGKGIVILIGGFILYALTVTKILSVTSIRMYEAQYSPTGNASPFGIGDIIMMLVFSVAYLVLWIWQIFSARKLAKKFNELVRTTHKEPW